jgi:hypothetical protein
MGCKRDKEKETRRDKKFKSFRKSMVIIRQVREQVLGCSEEDRYYDRGHRRNLTQSF